MNEIIEYLKRNIIVVIVAFLVIGIGGWYFLSHKETKPVQNEIKTETKVPKKIIQKESKEVTNKKNNLCVIDLQGAVKKPGVYRVKNGAIVQEILQMAGGLNSNADIKQLNQAKRVVDQMQIYVPTIGEKSSTGSTAGTGEKADNKVVNINTATVDDFKDVTGIGPKKAEKIIAFREKNGNFNSLHDLTKVSGIGEKSLDSLKDQLTV